MRSVCAVVFALQCGIAMLPVDIACDPPPLLPRPSRTWMRALARVAACGLAGLVIAGFVLPAPHSPCDCWDVGDQATLVAWKLANEAYPIWSREHPTHACPTSLAELAPYIGRSDARDPWGREYAFTCQDSRLFVMSLGEDGQANTADDIWSHESASRR